MTKVRMEEIETLVHQGVIDERTADDLFDTAADLTYTAFGPDASDHHIEWAFQRLVMQWRWGAGAQGVVTVH